MTSPQRFIEVSRGPNLRKAPLHLFPDYKVDKWDIPESDLVLREQIGSGYFGTVYKGSVQLKHMDPAATDTDAIRRSSLGYIVAAVKMLKGKMKISLFCIITFKLCAKIILCI